MTTNAAIAALEVGREADRRAHLALEMIVPMRAPRTRLAAARFGR